LQKDNQKNTKSFKKTKDREFSVFFWAELENDALIFQGFVRESMLCFAIQHR
jgi:hypothetical protein